MQRGLATIGVSLVALSTLTAPALFAVLTLEAEVNPDPAEPGEVVEVQISVASTAVAQNVTLQLGWPDPLNSTPFTTGGGSCSGPCSTGELLVWDLGTLGPGTVTTVAFSETVKGAALDGMASLDIDVLENAVIQDSLSIPFEIQADSALEIAVDPLSDPVVSGSTLVYELVYGNSSTFNATSSMLSFTVPDGTQFVAASGNGSLVGSTVTWDLGTVLAGDSGWERVTVEVDALNDGSLLVAEAVSFAADLNLLPQEARAMAVSRVDSEPLQLHMEVNPDPVDAGQMLDGQIVIGNPDGPLSGEISVRLLWPEELNSTPFRTGGGACSGPCDPGEYFTWVVGAMGPGQTAILSFDEIAKGALLDGTLIPLEVEVIEEGRPVRMFSRTIRVRTLSPLEVAVDPLLDPVIVGDPLTYEIVFSNTASAPAESAQLTFAIPDGTVFGSASGGGLFDQGTVTWDLGTLGGHSGGRRRVTVGQDTPRPAAGAEGILVAADAILADPTTLSATVDFLPHRSRAMALSRVDNEDLQMLMELNPDPVAPGAMADAQISISNATGSLTGDLTLRALWPEELGSTPFISDAGACSGPCDIGEFLTWNLPPLADGDTAAVSVNEVVKNAVVEGSLIPLEVELLDGGLPARSVSRTLRTQIDPLLEVLIDPLPDPVAPNSTLEYQIIYGNNAAAPAENATLTLPLPPGVNFVSATDGGVEQSGIVTWDLGTVPSNFGGVVRAQVQVLGLPAGTLITVDDVSLAATINFVAQEVRSSAVSRVDIEALALSATYMPNPVLPSGVLTVDITVDNTSGSTSGNLTLRVLWPEELNQTPDVTGGGACSGPCDTGEFLTWNLGMLAAGNHFTVQFEETAEANLTDGDLISIEIELLEDSLPARNLSQVIAVQPFDDNDGDGEADIFDEDDDNDGMPDWWEELHSLDPFDETDAGEDPDMDGLTNLQEFQMGTDPNVLNPIFIDGFESGDVTAWTSSVP